MLAWFYLFFFFIVIEKCYYCKFTEVRPNTMDIFHLFGFNHHFKWNSYNVVVVVVAIIVVTLSIISTEVLIIPFISNRSKEFFSLLLYSMPISVCVCFTFGYKTKRTYNNTPYFNFLFLILLYLNAQCVLFYFILQIVFFCPKFLIFKMFTYYP